MKTIKSILNFESSSVKLLSLLLLADIAFIILHCMYEFGALPARLSNPDLFSVERDLGYAEIFQHIKEGWIIALLAIVSLNRKQAIYYAWTLLFLYLLMDDALQIHEIGGEYLRDYFNIPHKFGIRGQDFGELFITAFAATFLFAFIAYSYLKADETAKKISLTFVKLVLAIAFFGIVVDMLHIALPFGGFILGLVEDGGEMIVISIILYEAFKLNPPAHAEIKL